MNDLQHSGIRINISTSFLKRCKNTVAQKMEQKVEVQKSTGSTGRRQAHSGVDINYKPC